MPKSHDGLTHGRGLVAATIMSMLLDAHLKAKTEPITLYELAVDTGESEESVIEALDRLHHDGSINLGDVPAGAISSLRVVGVSLAVAVQQNLLSVLDEQYPQKPETLATPDMLDVVPRPTAIPDPEIDDTGRKQPTAYSASVYVEPDKLRELTTGKCAAGFIPVTSDGKKPRKNSPGSKPATVKVHQIPGRMLYDGVVVTGYSSSEAYCLHAQRVEIPDPYVDPVRSDYIGAYCVDENGDGYQLVGPKFTAHSTTTPEQTRPPRAESGSVEVNGVLYGWVLMDWTDAHDLVSLSGANGGGKLYPVAGELWTVEEVNNYIRASLKA